MIEIQRIIGFLKSRGIGVLITDHNVRETLGICDHAYIISDGHVLAQGTPSQIVNNADVQTRLPRRALQNVSMLAPTFGFTSLPPKGALAPWGGPAALRFA